MRIEKQSFANSREEIDGKSFVDCRFDNVWLVYSGGELPDFERCAFTSIRVIFEGAALRTLALLQGMAQPGSGFEPVFAQMFAGMAPGDAKP